MIFDYETLKLIWWFLIGALFLMFALTGGFDLGVVALLPFVGRKDAERRILLNSVGATWEGNQVWLVTAVAAIFAAWPWAYASAFSILYFIISILVKALVLKPPGIDYRSKLAHKGWRRLWDGILSISGVVPALIFGLILGNVLQGLPFHYNEELRVVHNNSFVAYFNPPALLGAAMVLNIFLLQGSAWIAFKTREDLQARARWWLIGLALLCLVLEFSIWLFDLPQKTIGYRITSLIAGNESLNPLNKTVVQEAGAWQTNYQNYPYLRVLPYLAWIALWGVMISAWLRRFGLAIGALLLVVISLSLSYMAALFPFILPSSINPHHSLTLWDACSSHFTLMALLWAGIFFLPLVLAYTAWVYRVMRGPLLNDASSHKLPY